MSDQRYVSDELTHFVGRGLRTDEERFNLLLKIVRSGELRTPRNPDGSKKAGMTVNMNTGFFSERLVHEVPMVCFCDIPAGDLSIHMQKYSQFGIAFERPFLIGRGATPVFYIATDSIVHYSPNVDWAARRFSAGPLRRSEYLDDLVQQFHSGIADMHFLLMRPDMFDAATYNQLMYILMLMKGIDREFVSYAVPFAAALSERHPDNFYMEREWRTMDDVQFNLAHVCRIILPRNWAPRLRTEIPEYHAQVSFSG